jgi:hypothetical protein
VVPVTKSKIGSVSCMLETRSCPVLPEMFHCSTVRQGLFVSVIDTQKCLARRVSRGSSSRHCPFGTPDPSIFRPQREPSFRYNCTNADWASDVKETKARPMCSSTRRILHLFVGFIYSIKMIYERSIMDGTTSVWPKGLFLT